MTEGVNGAVMTVKDLPEGRLALLLARFGITLEFARDHIPGSFWGEPEAGIIGRTVHARGDTPVHSTLHEACHIICMTSERRDGLERDAGGDDLEESAVCYLQILLAESLRDVGKRRIMRDMDRWGYSFRLGSSRRWFEEDALDAREWLEENGLVDRAGQPTFRLRA